MTGMIASLDNNHVRWAYPGLPPRRCARRPGNHDVAGAAAQISHYRTLTEPFRFALLTRQIGGSARGYQEFFTPVGNPNFGRADMWPGHIFMRRRAWRERPLLPR